MLLVCYFEVLLKCLAKIHDFYFLNEGKFEWPFTIGGPAANQLCTATAAVCSTVSPSPFCGNCHLET